MGTGALSSVAGRGAGGGSGEHRGANPDPPSIALFCTEVSPPSTIPLLSSLIAV